MNQTVKAIYENGVLKPLKKVSLPEHKKVTIAILDLDDIPLNLLSETASKSKSFNFLKNKREDIYSIRDGKPV